MFFSIIIPVYNAEKYLSACLDSACNQNLPKSEYEIICVNDGSKDHSSEILENYKNKYPNITVIHKKNEGCSAARNDGMNLAKGDFLWFIDNDDLIAENILADMKRLIENELFDSYQFPYQSFTDNDLISSTQVKIKKDYIKDGGMIGNALWPQIFKTEFLRSNKLFHRGKRFDVPFYGFGMDALFLFECKRKRIRIKRIFDDKPIYFYRKSSNTITTDFSLSASIAKVSEYMEIIPILLDFYETDKHGNEASDTANILMDYVRNLYRSLVDLPWKYYRKYKKQLLKKGLFPFTQPAECTYTRELFINNASGVKKMGRILNYYSISSLGLSCFYLFNWTCRIYNKTRFLCRRIIKKLLCKR